MILKKGEKEQIGIINALRFLAAFIVMMYHYTFIFYQRGNTYADFGYLRGFFHYGYLGVDLFFIISGFVIALSAENRTWKDFTISRMTRLYPILWISVTITSISFLCIGYLIGEKPIEVIRYITNLTMVPTLFSQNPVDGSYWSLSLELKFYAFIGVILFLRLFKYLKNITLFLSFGLFILAFFFNLHPNYISYFLAGILFYVLYKEGLSKSVIVAIFTLMAVSIKYATFWSVDLTSAHHYFFSPYTIMSYVIIFYGIFFAVSLKKISLGNTRLLIALGAITYPLYLLHQEIGRMLFIMLGKTELNQWISFTCVVSGIIIISYILSTIYEKPVQNYLRGKLKVLFRN